MRVAVVLYEGFDELDAVGPYEVLRNARAGGADVETLLVTREPATTVTGSHGMTIGVHGVLDESFHLVVVPGGAWKTRNEVGAWGEIERGLLPSRLAELHASGAAMASVCTGGMLLSAAGITRGRPAITHHVAVEALREEDAQVVEERVVDDGDLVTSGGVTAGIDMALWLVEREWGAELADGVARGMEHTRVAGVHHGRSGRPG